MKIGIISHSPIWTTSFGITCNKIAFSLTDFGHSVACFAIGENLGYFDETKYPFKIWETCNTTLDAYTLSALIDSFNKFLRQECPNVLLINLDAASTTLCVKICKQLNFKKKIYARIVLDGYPALQNDLDVLKLLDGIIVPTKVSLRYLHAQGISKAYYAPNGVDFSEFLPINGDKTVSREKLKFKKKLKKTFIIGVFAHNEDRKQIPKVFLALQYLIYTLGQKNIFIYLHSQVEKSGKGWDLKFLASHLKIEPFIIFLPENFQQDIGIRNDDNQLSYVERINMCDLIVNIPFSSGFGLCNIEAQACGIPIITINDRSNIKEIIGKSALFIEPSMKNISKTGALIYLIDEVELAEKILQIKNNYKLQIELKERGITNAKKFPWLHLEKAIIKMVSS